MQLGSSRRRRGSAILMAAAMIGALTVFAIFQQHLARQSLVVVQRANLSSLAVLQGESAIEELVDQVAVRANDPTTPLFKELRALMRAPWERLDLTPFLTRPEIAVHPRAGFLGSAPRDAGALAAEVTEFQARLRGPRYAPGERTTEEFTAILTLSVIVKATNPRGELLRRVSATYEVRGLMTTPPRPFDQAGFFVQGAEAVVDLGAIDRERDQLVQDYEAFRQRLEAAAATQAVAGARLTELAAGMAPEGQLESALPRHGPLAGGALFGPRHGAFVTGGELDLPRELARRRAQRAELQAAFEAALGRPDQVGDAAFEVVSSLRGAVAEFTRFHGQFALVGPSSDDYRDSLAPYFDRLEPGFYQDRVHLRVPADSPLVARWAAGGARLTGVVALEPGAGELRIGGRPRGQVVLVTGGQHVILDGQGSPAEDEEAPAPGASPDRLLVVSVGGDVTVQGDVRASVFMVPREGGGGGKLRVRSGARLTGVVAVGAARPGQVALEGTLVHDGSLRSVSPAAAGAAPAPDPEGAPPRTDPYTIVLSPMPIF